MDPELRSLRVNASASRIQNAAAAKRARRDFVFNAALLATVVVGAVAHALEWRNVVNACLAALSLPMAYSIYIAFAAMKAYNVSIMNLPEPEPHSDDEDMDHHHFHAG